METLDRLLEEGRISGDDYNDLRAALRRRDDSDAGSRRGGPPRLTRSWQGRMLSGVCAGLADYFHVDPTLVRIGFAALTLLTSGAGLLLYIAMALITPWDEPPSHSDKTWPFALLLVVTWVVFLFVSMHLSIRLGELYAHMGAPISPLGLWAAPYYSFANIVIQFLLLIVAVGGHAALAGMRGRQRQLRWALFALLFLYFAVPLLTLAWPLLSMVEATR